VSRTAGRPCSVARRVIAATSSTALTGTIDVLDILKRFQHLQIFSEIGNPRHQ
jgi:hypothetical protein